MPIGLDDGGGQPEMSEINVTPLVDVMLVLLAIFMVTVTMLQRADDSERKVDLNLPVTKKNPNEVDTSKTDKLILEITKNLRVQIGEEVIADCSDRREGDDPKRFEPCFDTIEEKLGKNPKLEEDETLYLLADTDIPYGFVVGTMARIKKAGVHRLGMVTNPAYIQNEGASGESSE